MPHNCRLILFTLLFKPCNPRFFFFFCKFSKSPSIIIYKRNKFFPYSLILQLCKNAESLDEDEKGVCIVRLKNIAENFNDTYVGDLLMLSARKLNNHINSITPGNRCGAQ